MKEQNFLFALCNKLTNSNLNCDDIITQHIKYFMYNNWNIININKCPYSMVPISKVSINNNYDILSNNYLYYTFVLKKYNDNITLHMIYTFNNINNDFNKITIMDDGKIKKYKYENKNIIYLEYDMIFMDTTCELKIINNKYDIFYLSSGTNKLIKIDNDYYKKIIIFNDFILNIDFIYTYYLNYNLNLFIHADLITNLNKKYFIIINIDISKYIYYKIVDGYINYNNTQSLFTNHLYSQLLFIQQFYIQNNHLQNNINNYTTDTANILTQTQTQNQSQVVPYEYLSSIESIGFGTMKDYVEFDNCNEKIDELIGSYDLNVINKYIENFEILNEYFSNNKIFSNSNDNNGEINEKIKSIDIIQTKIFDIKKKIMDMNQQILDEKNNYDEIAIKTKELIFFTNELLKIDGIKIIYKNTEIILINSIDNLGQSYFLNEKIYNIKYVCENLTFIYDNQKYIKFKTLDNVFMLKEIYIKNFNISNPNFDKILEDLNKIVKNIKKVK